MLSKIGTLSFFAGASALVYTQTKKISDEAQVRAIVPHPLPSSELNSIVVEASRCEEVGPKPAGELSGAIVVVRPYSPGH